MLVSYIGIDKFKFYIINMKNTFLYKNSFYCSLLFILALSILFIDNNFAFAADPKTGLEEVLCRVIKYITGGVGKSIAILIIISMAMGLFLGKITWGVAICVMVGMGMLFGAESVVQMIAPPAKGGTSSPICDVGP